MICNISYITIGLFISVSSGQTPDSPPPSLTVITTTGMVADVAEGVGGDRVEVDVIMGQGVDPHLYKPTASDVRRTLNADVVLYNGLKLEGRMSDALDKSRALGRTVVAIAEACPRSQLRDGDEEGYMDPHVWMDVGLWATTIDSVTEAFCKSDPEGCPKYRENAKAYRAELLALDQKLANEIATIPSEQRVLITAHDAFGYFGSAYDVEVRAVQGISTSSEAGLAELNELINFIVDRKISAVFIETSVSPRAIEALIEGAQARGHTVSIGGELFSDAMGKPGTPEGTYQGMMRHNAKVITSALRGAPSTEKVPAAEPSSP